VSGGGFEKQKEHGEASERTSTTTPSTHCCQTKPRGREARFKLSTFEKQPVTTSASAAVKVLIFAPPRPGRHQGPLRAATLDAHELSRTVRLQRLSVQPGPLKCPAGEPTVAAAAPSKSRKAASTGSSNPPLSRHHPADHEHLKNITTRTITASCDHDNTARPSPQHQPQILIARCRTTAKLPTARAIPAPVAGAIFASPRD